MCLKRYKNRVIEFCALFLCFIILLSECIVTTSAQSPNRSIKVGYLNNYGITNNENNNTKSGYCYEYLQEIAKYTGWKYEFIPVAWDEGLEKLALGEIDIFGPMQKNAERESIFDFTDKEMGFEYGALYILENNSSVYYSDPMSYDGLRVGTEKNNFYNAPMEEYCKSNGISVEYVYTDATLLGEGLINGDYDAFISGSLMDITNSVVATKIAVEPYYYATTKGNTEILESLNVAINAITIEDIHYALKLDQKYYGNKSINMPAFTKSELDFIQNNKVLNVVCDPVWVPIEYYDAESSTFKGINVDILSEISKICGIQFRYLKSNDYAEGKQMMKDGRADLLMGYMRNEMDTTEINYTEPILEIPVVLVASTSVDVSGSMKVAIRESNSPISIKIMEKYPGFTYINCADSQEVITKIKGKEADAAFINFYVLDDLARNGLVDNFITITTTIDFDQCIGVSSSIDPILVSILNKSAHRLTAEQTNTIIFTNTINRAYTVPFTRIIKEYTFLIISILFGFLVVVAILGIRNKEKFERIAYIDALTKIPTIVKFKIVMADMLKNATSCEYTVISLDIDDFKYINNSFGYQTGNEILIAVSEHFLHHIKVGEIIGRNSADNFVFLIKTPADGTIAQFYNVICDVKGHIAHILPEHYTITMSIGSYVIENINEDISIIFDKVNFARKSIKGSTTNDYAEYTAEMDRQSEWKKQVTLSMESALLNREFEVYLQPKYLLASETLIGAEALVRWNHSTRGELSPFEFIPIFEQNGFITKLDFYIFEEVCILLKKWANSGLNSTPITVSVNLSRLHLHNKNLVDELLEITNRYQIPTRLLEIELTESAVFHNAALLIEIMKKIRKEGFLISIDDFGSGYSSLNMLKDLPVDILKIDKEFLSDSSEVHNGRVIIESVTKMAKSLNLITVAEGVETKEQAQMLLNMGCDIAQGYYYAKPMPIAEFEKLLV